MNLLRRMIWRCWLSGGLGSAICCSMQICTTSWWMWGWGVAPEAYIDLCQQWQLRPCVGWFARPWSAKCHMFYSRFLTPGAAGVDAFDHCWRLSCGVGYICPPQMVVASVLQKILDDRASCLLILPAWYKACHSLLGLLPIQQQTLLHASVICWGDKAPEPNHRSRALMAGLRADNVVFD